jgi:hypothetical protein
MPDMASTDLIMPVNVRFSCEIDGFIKKRDTRSTMKNIKRDFVFRLVLFIKIRHLLISLKGLKALL